MKLKEDLDRHFFLARADTFWQRLFIVLSTQGVWATIVYRAGSWCVQDCKSRILRKLLIIPLRFLSKLMEILTGIYLPFTAKIGRGLYIAHFSGIGVHPQSELGEYCQLAQGVNVGFGGSRGEFGVPKIGDRVYMAAGAKVLGPIEIGNDVAIGSNAVVVKSLPDNAVAVGVPAKIVNYNGSSAFNVYRKKEQPES
jgi:serine O-acetyltransferase